MKFGIIAIHGGAIEPGTDAIARAIAGEQFPFYINTKGPHVASVDFTNPEIEKFLMKVDVVISIHGEHSTDESFVMIGGLHVELREKIKSALEEAGFNTKEPDDAHDGDNPKNVCNRGRSGMGVQLEISRKLRDELIQDKNMLRNFSNSITQILNNFS